MGDSGWWAALVAALAQVYLRFTDPKRKLAKLRIKLERNCDQQQKLLQLPSTLAHRRKLTTLVHDAVQLRRQIVELESRD